MPLLPPWLITPLRDVDERYADAELCRQRAQHVTLRDSYTMRERIGAYT